MTRTPTVATAPVPEASPPTTRMRRTVAAASIGSFVEYYDFAAYGALAIVLSGVFFPRTNSVADLLSTFAIFAVAFFVRPLGGVVWGVLGDRIGRRRTLVAVIVVMAVSTVGIGLLPGYDAIGVLSPILLLLLRCTQGFSAGGEVMGAATFVAEHSPEGRRAFMTSFIQVSTTAAILAGAGTAYVLTSTLSPEAMTAWGWRIPFLVAGPLGVVALYIRLKLDDPPRFPPPEPSRTPGPGPLRESLATRENRRQVMLAGGTAVLQFVAFYLLLTYMPTYLSAELGFTPADAFGSLVIATLFLVAAIPLAGIVSDRFGRRPTLMVSSVVFLVLAYPCFLLIATGGLWAVVLGQVLLAVPASATAANMLAAQTELFPTRIRYTGYAIGMNVGNALFGGTAPFIATGLIHLTGTDTAPSFYLMFAAMCSIAAAMAMRETARTPLRG